MKKLVLLILLVFICVLSTRAQSLDQYGGREDIFCTVTGWFHMQKIGNRWWGCTPLGHGTWFNGIYNLSPTSFTSNVGTKYGSVVPKTYEEENIRLLSWGFNMLDWTPAPLTTPVFYDAGFPVDGSGHNSNPNPIPFIWGITPSKYALANLFSYETQVPKDIVPLVSPYFTAGGGYTTPNGIIDWYDPGYGQEVTGELANAGIQLDNISYMVAWEIDDGDQLGGTSESPDFISIPSGHNLENLGMTITTLSPLETANSTVAPGAYPSAQVYPNTQVYSKLAFRDAMVAKYTTIGAMDTAWSTSTDPTQTWNFTQSTSDGSAGSYSTSLAGSFVQMGWTLTTSESGALVGVAIHPSGGSAPTIDNTGQSVNTCSILSVPTCTLPSFVIGAGSNRLLFVSVTYRCGVSVSGVTFGGVALTRIGGACETLNGRAVDIWYLKAPATSTANIVATFNSTSAFDAVTVAADSWAGVNQTTPVGTIATFVQNSGTNPSINITAGANDIVHSALTWFGGSGSSASMVSSAVDYTTFDSSGVCVGSQPFTCASSVSADSVGTGNGSTLTFSTTLSHTVVSEFSLQILVSGTAIAGEDAYVPGNIWGPNAAGTITRSTGALSLTVGDIITGATVGTAGTGFAPGDTLSVAGGVEGIVTVATISGGGATGPIATFNIKPSGHGAGYTAGLKSLTVLTGSGSGSPTATITVGGSPVANSAAITATYVANGWGIGSGFLDEDDRVSHQGYLGTDFIGMTGSSAASLPGTTGATAVARNDINTMFTALMAHVFSGNRTRVDSWNAGNSPATHIMYWGPNSLGSFGVPPMPSAMQGAAPYLDAWVAGNSGDGSQISYTQAMMDYVEANWGDQPYQESEYDTANADSPVGGSPVPGPPDDFATQALRGAAFVTGMTNAVSGTATTTGNHPIVGMGFYQMFDSNQGNFGLVTDQDNVYNASEPAGPGTVTCSAPTAAYTCGSEPTPGTGGGTRPYGNLLTSVVSANALWLGIAPPTSTTKGHPGTKIHPGSKIH